MISNHFIIYDQPVNEHVRICLRLEHLFNQVLHWMHGTHSWDSHAALSALLDIINILDRPDLKSKLVKELSRYVTLLTRFAETPHIDTSKLKLILGELEHVVHILHTTQGRLAQTLRDNEFLMVTKQYLLSSAGGCSFDVPAYYHWLQQPTGERISQLSHWLSALKTVQTAVELTLRLIRQSNAPQLHVAQEGFYQTALDASLPCQLVRVGVPQNAGVYPEISIGRHGVSIRFYILNLAQRSVQTSENVRFQLTCCVF